jgi:hypothetical protein
MRARARSGAVTPAQAAWLAALPSALLAAAAIVLLAQPLGGLIFAPRGTAFWPSSLYAVKPEPTEHAAYAIALLGPLLVAGAALLAARRAPRTAMLRAVQRLVWGAQALLAAGIVACLWIEHTQALSAPFSPPIQYRAFFTLASLGAAALVAAVLAVVLTRPRTRARAGRLLGDTPARRLAAIAAAVLLLGLWMLSAVNSERTIANVLVARSDISIWLDEAAAVLNGSAPLVGLHAQYAQLWPYASAAVMAVAGTSVGVFAATMLAGTAAAMLAVLAVLQRVTRSWTAAVLLFAPFVATSFFMISGTPENRFSPLQLYSLFPLRYAGPYLLAWLTVRHLDGVRPRRSAWLFLAGGLVAINNVEFGFPALAGTFAAVLLARGLGSRRDAGRLVAQAAIGSLGALVAVSALTLVVAGSLPHLGFALTFARIFGIEGFGMIPMRPFGFHLVMYATFAAAIATGAVRAGRGDARPLTGALVWSGVFGLGAGSYFVGRSHPDVLINLFSTWALALVLLLVALVEVASRSPGWRLSPANVALMFGVGLSVCSIAQMPTPWSQLDRLAQPAPSPTAARIERERTIAEATRPGEHVALLAMEGHRMAEAVGIVDVTPYADANLLTQRQLKETISALRATGGTRIVADQNVLEPTEAAAIVAAGFRFDGNWPYAELVSFGDTRRTRR